LTRSIGDSLRQPKRSERPRSVRASHSRTRAGRTLLTLQVEERSLDGARRSFPKDLADFEWTIRHVHGHQPIDLRNGVVVKGPEIISLVLTGKPKQPHTIEGELADAAPPKPAPPVLTFEVPGGTVEIG
jgi:hypothetical protein